MGGGAEAVEYREIPGYPGYRAGSDGSIWSCRVQGKLTDVWRQRRCRTHRSGYLHLNVMLDARRASLSVHRLVMLAFRGPCPAGLETRHLNGNRADNRLANLAYGTKKENAADRVAHGTINRGEKNGLAKLAEADVIAIRFLFARGVGPNAIAGRFGVCSRTVRKIRDGELWRRLLPESKNASLSGERADHG